MGTRSKRVRIGYTGGYVMPGEVAGPGQTALPPILEAAAIEQVAMWYQLEATTGIFRVEGGGGTYLEVADRVWVPWVKRVLGRYRKGVLG